MNTEPGDDNIPTLTRVIVPGDESMKNHFDGHMLDEENTDEAIVVEGITAVEEDSGLPEEENDFTIGSEVSTEAIDPPILEEPVIVEPASSGPALDLDELETTIESAEIIVAGLGRGRARLGG